MKKILLFTGLLLLSLNSFAQPQALLDETWYVRYLNFDSEPNYTPVGENLSLTFSEVSGTLFMEVSGIENQFTAEVNFSGNTFTTSNPSVTLLDCTQPNCTFENNFFYEVLTNQNLDGKTFTFTFNQFTSNVKDFWFRDPDLNSAYFVNRPIEPNPDIFQTWYLYSSEVDLGDTFIYTGPDVPSLTIAPDFTFTGVNGTTNFEGNFIYGEDFVNEDEFILILENLSDPNTGIPDLIEFETLHGYIDSDVFSIESFPGFISTFKNSITLDIAENTLQSSKIYPNPVKDVLNFTHPEQIVSITIYTVMGEKIVSTQLLSQPIGVSFLNTGVYFVAIETIYGKETKKIVKQ